MNKKLLLGALIGAGISLLNKKRRQQPAASTPDIQMPDFSKVPPPTSTAGAGDGQVPTDMDDILARANQRANQPSGQGQAPGAGDIFGGAFPGAGGAAGTAGGAAVLMEIGRRVLEQMQQQKAGAPGAQGGGLNDVLGQIFGRMNGKFGQQGPMGQQKNPKQWNTGSGGLFGFAASGAAQADGEDQAELLLNAMVAAAQADGQIDESELNNITKSLNGQLDSAEVGELKQLLTQPVDIDQLVAKVDDPATALQMYLVSAMTINEGNPAEKQYMDQLADKLGISEQAAQVIERQLPRA